jgi:hypothetical protein
MGWRNIEREMGEKKENWAAAVAEQRTGVS